MYHAIPKATFSIITLVALVAGAAAAPKSKNAESTTPGIDPVAKKLGTQLQAQFKSWDRDKDDYVSKEELHKAFGKGKASQGRRPRRRIAVGSARGRHFAPGKSR